MPKHGEQVAVVDVVEEAFDVGLNDPAAAAAMDIPAQSLERVVAAFARAKTVREGVNSSS